MGNVSSGCGAISFFYLIGADDWATVAQMGLVSGKCFSSRAQLNFDEMLLCCEGEDICQERT